MSASEQYGKGDPVDSEIGKRSTDSEGSPVCGAGIRERYITPDRIAALMFIRENGKKVEYRLTDPNKDEAKRVLESQLFVQVKSLQIFMGHTIL